jgi:hypothetical protein
MAKKMQRLDESPDFRPFKFRIQAFTNAFLEEVSLLLRAPRARFVVTTLLYFFSLPGKDILRTKYP